MTAPVVLGVLAFVHPGQAVSQLDLNDGAVWVTNGSTLQLGRYSSTVDELNAGLVATSAQLDVLQDAGDVLLVEPGWLSVVDPAGVALAARTPLPADARVSMAAGTVAVLDPADGAVWAGSVGTLGELRTDGPADAELGAGGVAVVAATGAVLTRSADGVRGALALPGAGGADSGDAAESAEATTGPAGPAPTSGPAPTLGTTRGAVDQATAVGDALVVLAGATLETPSGPVDLAAYGSDLRLQQPGPDAPDVLVATPTSLLEVPLDGGAVRELPSGGSGAPAAPVRVRGCVHAAWATGTGSALTRCGSAPPEVVDLAGLTAQDALVFRVNRSVVVLNDTARGRLWVPTEDPELREPNWTDLEPEARDEDTETAADTDGAGSRQAAECTPGSAPPTAADDTYGVRAGRTTVLPVLDNDASSDCGVLAVSEVDALPADIGTVEVVHGGRALQVALGGDARGAAAVTYTVTDGRGSSAPSTATVRVAVVPAGVDTAPVQDRERTVVVEQGGEVSADVLPDFRDADGDALTLVGATPTGTGTVRSRPDGRVTFVEDGGPPGVTDVRLLVTDGARTAEGVLHVDVRPTGSVAPVLDPVHAVGLVGSPVTVRPLDAVRSGTSEPARLAAVDPLTGVTVEPDLDGGTFTVTAPRPGTFYVTFLVTASGRQTTGVARVDVRERPAGSGAPVAVADRALLPAAGEVAVDPLANDVDPAGGVLVLQSVDAPAASGLQVTVVDHRLLRITATRTPEAPVTVPYVVSNGTAEARGEVLVVPVPPSAAQHAPVVADVEVSVRTGGVVTVPVLDGAVDPDGDRLELVRDLPGALPAGAGSLFVSGDVLRYSAPDRPTTARTAFDVRDAAGNVGTGWLTVTVHAADAATKAPPRPEPVTARVFAGETTRITIPLVGIDPDGDGVTLLGPDRVPGKGRIVGMGADWLEYEADPERTGTDEFTYAVEDWAGQRAVATVRVGISPRPGVESGVVARDDEVRVRPGQVVQVRVLGNDADQTGDPLLLEPALRADPGVEARVDGDRIVVRAPQGPGTVHVAYTAATARGRWADAVLSVTVDPEAPVLAPVARDVVVPAADTVGRTQVEVAVLAVADNLSGPVTDLAVSVDPADAPTATVSASGTVVVTLVDRPQTLPYVLTNTTAAAGGIRAVAFITVPALGDFPPMPRPGARDLEVVAGQQLPISLAEQVQVGPGRTASVSDPARVQATRSDGSPLVQDAWTLLFRAPVDYAGAASVLVEVTDATGPDDPDARTRVLSLPITVYAADDRPPAFAASTVDVAPGEAAVTVDLRALTSGAVGAPGAGDYRYALTSPPPDGFTAALEGPVLRVAAPTTTPVGTSTVLPLTVAYGADRSVPARLDLRVVASTRPLARVVDVDVPDGVEDRATTVPVLEGAFNPFPGSPLTVVRATVETPGAGTATSTGSAVSVRPAAGFIGSMVTRFTVRDATGDPAREVEGRVTVTVRGRPGAPTTPRVVEVRDSTVVLAWDAPVANGEPVTGYRVTATPGGAVRECPGTTCTVDGLTNDTEYTFTVAARNAVDLSPESAPSAPARPDARPDAVAAPTVVAGDRELTVAWDAPRSPGSPVQQYTVEVSPAPSGGAATTTTATTATVRGVTNGVRYAVRVRAHNAATEPGDWSAWSPGAVPAGLPAAPQASATRYAEGGFSPTGRIDLAWTAPADNGAPVTAYEVSVDGTPVATVPATTTGWSLEPAERGRRYTLEVRARNLAGWSAAQPVTAQTWSAPSEPRAATATATGGPEVAWGDGSVELAWQPPADAGGAGLTVTGYEIEGVGRVAGTTFTVPDLVAGPSPTYRVRAWSSREEPGEWSVIPSVTVTTAPESPQVLLAADGTSRASLSWEPRRDGGSPVTAARYRVDGQEWVPLPVTVREARIERDPAAGTTVEVQVRNALGWSAGAVVTASAAPPVPEPADPPGPAVTGTSTGTSTGTPTGTSTGTPVGTSTGTPTEVAP